ncbi:MAG TPA: hypothetical protein VLC55_06130 [Burkholderiales bacterium]|nr:hypothetical protein [Burkholderiales bacterium]
MSAAASFANWCHRLGRLALAAAFFFAFLESVTVAAEWWQGTRAMQPRDWLWVAALPVLIGIYLRFFSVLRPECKKCAVPTDEASPRG